MNRTTIWTLVLSLALASAAGAAPTPEEICQKAKLIALGKRDLCLKTQHGKEVTGKTADTALCEDKFTMLLMKADDAAAKKGASCRWLDNEDGTATDLNSGLQWELKNDNGPTDVHDKDNTYTWCVDADVDFECDKPGDPPDGTAFTEFLVTLNRGVSADFSTTTGCFAGHCDWRLPTIGELRSMLDTQNCTMMPCFSIPGLTASFFYWSSSTNSVPYSAWGVNVDAGVAVGGGKIFDSYVRAVRGGSGA